MEDRYRDYGPVMLFRYGRTFKVQLNSMRTDDLSLLQKNSAVYICRKLENSVVCLMKLPSYDNADERYAD